MITTFLATFGINITPDLEQFAQTGDFFGGFLNPILTFATIALLVWSIRLQMDELKQVSEELRMTKEIHESSGGTQLQLLESQKEQAANLERQFMIEKLVAYIDNNKKLHAELAQTRIHSCTLDTPIPGDAQYLRLYHYLTTDTKKLIESDHDRIMKHECMHEPKLHRTLAEALKIQLCFISAESELIRINAPWYLHSTQCEQAYKVSRSLANFTTLIGHSLASEATACADHLQSLLNQVQDQITFYSKPSTL